MKNQPECHHRSDSILSPVNSFNNKTSVDSGDSNADPNSQTSDPNDNGPGLDNADDDSSNLEPDPNDQQTNSVSMGLIADPTLKQAVEDTLHIENPNQETLHLVLEGGIQYVLNNASLEVVQTLDGTPDPGSPFETDCGNAIVGRIGGGLQWDLESVRLLINGGYQFDIDNAKAESETLQFRRDIELAAFYAQIGLAIPLH